MSIRKKFLAGLLVAVSAAACAFGAFGCSGSNNTNKEPENKPPVIDEGSFETSWTNDNDYHGTRLPTAATTSTVKLCTTGWNRRIRA